jgi:hypothetical protein
MKIIGVNGLSKVIIAPIACWAGVILLDNRSPAARLPI